MTKKIILLILSFVTGLTLLACKKTTIPSVAQANPENAVYYEILVRSFADSDGDGVGDFNGITAKLDYLKDLGIDGVWLMPINPSPSYHGYDVMDYYDVNEEYGTMADFENLVAEADAHGIRIMLDMVFNHTSSQHPWFLAAVAGDTTYQDYYVTLSKTTSTEGLLGSWNQNIWHSNNTFKYVGYFSYTMPDLNMENPVVRTEIANITKFWIDKGVKGFRLDAVHHLYGDNEYLDIAYDYIDNVMMLQEYTTAIDAYADDIYIVGEVYEETLYEVVGDYYYGIDAPLDFPIERLIRNSFQKTTNRTYVSTLENIYEAYRAAKADFIDAPFAGNHDMIRLASIVNGDFESLRMVAEMLLTLPGNPIIYYGDELGMFGYKASGPDIWDETIRLPMRFGDEYQTDWINSANAALVSLATLNAPLGNVTTQLANPSSLLNVYKALLALRHNNIALMYGNTFTPYELNNASLQGFYREYTYNNVTQRVLVIHNFATTTQLMIEFQGTILYASNVTDPSTMTSIPAQSTLIIDVTSGGQG